MTRSWPFIVTIVLGFLGNSFVAIGRNRLVSMMNSLTEERKKNVKKAGDWILAGLIVNIVFWVIAGVFSISILNSSS